MLIMSLFKFMKICLNKKSACFTRKIDIALHHNEKNKCTYLLLLLLYEKIITTSDSVCIYSKYKLSKKPF